MSDFALDDRIGEARQAAAYRRPASGPARRRAAAAAGDRVPHPASAGFPVVYPAVDAALRQPAFDAARHGRDIQSRRIPGGLDLARRLIVFANTVGISLVKTVIALALAVLFAWIMARTNTPLAARWKC